MQLDFGLTPLFLQRGFLHNRPESYQIVSFWRDIFVPRTETPEGNVVTSGITP